MKRKRFIRLLMSDGIPRNDAVSTCKMICFMGDSYESFYNGWMRMWGRAKKLMDGLEEKVSEVGSDEANPV